MYPPHEPHLLTLQEMQHQFPQIEEDDIIAYIPVTTGPMPHNHGVVAQANGELGTINEDHALVDVEMQTLESSNPEPQANQPEPNANTNTQAPTVPNTLIWSVSASDFQENHILHVGPPTRSRYPYYAYRAQLQVCTQCLDKLSIDCIYSD